MDKNNGIELKLEELRQKEAEDLARMLAEKHGLPYADLSRMTIDLDALKLVPEDEARAVKMAIFQKVAKKLQIAVLNPELAKTKDVLNRLSEDGYRIDLFFVSESSLLRAWSRYKEVPAFEEIESGLIDISPERLEEFQKEVRNIADLQRLIEPHLNAQKIRRVSETVEAILAGALA